MNSRFCQTALFPLLLIAGLAARAHAVTVKLSEADGPEVALSLHVGDRIRVELPAQPSTGFRWNLATRLSPHLLAVGSTVRESSGLMGGPGVQSYTWQVLQPGEDTVVLQYNRSFEPAVAPARTYSLHITSTAAPGAKPSTAQPALTLLGSYSGQQPCADCSGIHVELLLYSKGPNEFIDTAYILKRTYQGGRNGNLTMVETGPWLVLRGTHADADATVYQLLQNPGATPQNFAVQADRLVPLDAQQIPLPGPPGMDLALHKMPQSAEERTP